ncbi:hypothetical protein [Kingella potus]|nr:hypothetical protein [Kingella potus]
MLPSYLAGRHEHSRKQAVWAVSQPERPSEKRFSDGLPFCF